MIAADLIAQVRDAGGQIAADGADLVLTAAHPLPPDLLDLIKVHKPALLAELTAADDPLWWRVTITEPGGRTIEVDTPSGWTLGEWAVYAERYHGPGCAVAPLLPLPKPRAPVNLEEALRTACGGAGISPEVFRSLLSPEDLSDIAAGAIHPRTLRAYAASFSEGMRSGRIVVPGGELDGKLPTTRNR